MTEVQGAMVLGLLGFIAAMLYFINGKLHEILLRMLRP